MTTFETAVLGYLLNSLWEVPVIFAAGWLAVSLVRRIGPQPGLEHRVWVGALVLEAVLPACHPDLERLGLLARQLWGAGAGTAGGEARVMMGAGSVSSHGLLLRLPAVALAGIVVAYGCSVLYFAGRLGWGLWQTGRLQARAERVALVGEAGRGETGRSEMGRRLARCGRIFGVEDVVIAISDALAGPVTVGVVRRMLLVPPGFLERVTADDLEALAAHEFAHMRRRDFLKNIVYGILTLPVTYHPVLWLTRARLAESREMVCDQMAAAAVAGEAQYARSLLRLAAVLASRASQRRFAGRTQARTLHAIGIFDANIFERRVMNLIQRRVEIKGVRRLMAAVVCGVVGMATCASALALRMEVGAPVAANGSAARVKVEPGVVAGSNTYKKNPTYPQDAKDAKIAGAVVLKAVIGKDGTIEKLEVVSGPEKLQRSALDAVRQWTYKPYLLNGHAVEVETTITVTYSLAA